MSTEIENWAKKYEDLTNGDETIKAMAKYYTCSFMFDMENAKVIIEMPVSYTHLTLPTKRIV